MKQRLRSLITAAASVTPGLRAVYAENAALKQAIKAASVIQQQLLADAGRMRQARAGLPADFDLIVPVCNAAGWLPYILDAYEQLRLNPLFIVDQRSSDSSLDILTARGARRILAPSGEQPTVESLLFPVLHCLQTKYILRLDDDELPSPALLSWISENFDNFTESVIAFPRRWIARLPDGCLMMTSGQTNHGLLQADYQYRLFRPQNVRPIRDLHSPGFIFTEFETAPSDVVIYHLDWIVRTYKQRQAKAAGYNTMKAGLGSHNARFSLPEDQNFDGYGLEPLAEPLMISTCRKIEAEISTDESICYAR